MVCRPPLPLANPCSNQEEAAIDAGMALALHSTATGDGAWRRWLAVRDAIAVGRAHRYSEPQLQYHYQPSLQLLNALMRNWVAPGGPSPGGSG
jgi:hypothetical protein